MTNKKVEKLLDELEALIDIKLIIAFQYTPVYTNTMSDTPDVWKPVYYEKREQLRLALMRVLEDGDIRG